MDAKTLEKMRPRDASSAEIAASIERMNAVLLELRAELSAAEATRRGLLLTASNAEIEKHDSRLRSLRLDVERLELQIDAIGPDLAIARGRERLARLAELRAAADEAHEAFATFWADEYPALARAIAAGLALGDRADVAINVYAQAAEAARRDRDVEAAGGFPAGQPRDRVLGFVGHTGKHPAALICLPSTTPGLPIVWPRDYSLQPIRRGEAAAYAR